MPADLYTVWLGVPPGKRPPSHHTLLGLPADCTDAKQIEQAAYAQLDKLDKFSLTPDRAKREACQEMMNEVARARGAMMAQAGPPETPSPLAEIIPQIVAAQSFASAPAAPVSRIETRSKAPMVFGVVATLLIIVAITALVAYHFATVTPGTPGTPSTPGTPGTPGTQSATSAIRNPQSHIPSPPATPASPQPTSVADASPRQPSPTPTPPAPPAPAPMTPPAPAVAQSPEPLVPPAPLSPPPEAPPEAPSVASPVASTAAPPTADEPLFHGMTGFYNIKGGAGNHFVLLDVPDGQNVFTPAVAARLNPLGDPVVLVFTAVGRLLVPRDGTYRIDAGRACSVHIDSHQLKLDNYARRNATNIPLSQGTHSIIVHVTNNGGQLAEALLQVTDTDGHALPIVISAQELDRVLTRHVSGEPVELVTAWDRAKHLYTGRAPPQPTAQPTPAPAHACLSLRDLRVDFQFPTGGTHAEGDALFAHGGDIDSGPSAFAMLRHPIKATKVEFGFEIRSPWYHMIRLDIDQHRYMFSRGHWHNSASVFSIDTKEKRLDGIVADAKKWASMSISLDDNKVQVTYDGQVVATTPLIEPLHPDSEIRVGFSSHQTDFSVRHVYFDKQ